MDTRLTCLLLFLQGKGRSSGSKGKERTDCAVTVSARLLTCQEARLSVWGFMQCSPAPGPGPLFPSCGPQQCLVLSKLQGRKRPCFWPGSPHGVQCVSLLHHTLPASARGASSPRNARPSRSHWCCRIVRSLGPLICAYPPFLFLSLMLSSAHAVHILWCTSLPAQPLDFSTSLCEVFIALIGIETL